MKQIWTLNYSMLISKAQNSRTTFYMKVKAIKSLFGHKLNGLLSLQMVLIALSCLEEHNSGLLMNL